METSIYEALNLAGQLGSDIEVESRIKGPIVRADTVRTLLDMGNWTKRSYLEMRTKNMTSSGNVVYRSINEENVICKSKIKRYKCLDEWVSVVVSIEKDTGSRDMLSEKHFKEHEKIRYSKVSMSGTTRIDVTYIKEEDEYQVEVEALEGCTPQNLYRSTQEVVRILLDSPMYISRKKFETVREALGGTGYYVSNTISTNAMGSIDVDKKTNFSIAMGKYQKPVTLTSDRLMSIFKEGIYITAKLDGVRRFLVIFNGFVYDVDPEHFHIRLIKRGDYLDPFPTIFDSELVDGEYYIIDVCVYEGQYMGYLSLLSRLKCAKKCTYLPGKLKEYVRLFEQDPVFQIEEFHADYITKHILIDGIIFVNEEKDYMYNVVKWKPSVTIDLNITKQELDERIIPNNLDTNNVDVKYDGVYECEIVGVVDCKKSGPKLDLKILRYRHDKKKPNSNRVIIENVNGFYLRGVWSGLGCILMRKYHNIIKRKLLKEVITHKFTVLDLGSGQGGDITKWDGAKKVFCVEPNKDAIKEFKRRLKDSKVEHKIKIINCRSSNTEKIFSKVEKIDVISAFFTINLFTQKDLDGLVDIVSKYRPRYIIGTFLDLKKIKYVDRSPCYTISPTDKGYHIHLHDTRINQDEYLFSLDQLRLDGYKLVYCKPLDNGKWMSQYEKELSSMYCMFRYEKM